MNLLKTATREGIYLRTVAVLIFVWMLLPSGLFLRPHSLQFTPNPAGGYMVDFARAKPLGAVRAKWHTELRSRSECEAAARDLTSYEARGLKAVGFPLRDALARCLRKDLPFSYAQYHTVYALGLLPLRTSLTVWHCPAIGVPCLRD